jgi:hypothetical protein
MMIAVAAAIAMRFVWPSVDAEFLLVVSNVFLWFTKSGVGL